MPGVVSRGEGYMVGTVGIGIWEGCLCAWGEVCTEGVGGFMCLWDISVGSWGDFGGCCVGRNFCVWCSEDPGLWRVFVGVEGLTPFVFVSWPVGTTSLGILSGRSLGI